MAPGLALDLSANDPDDENEGFHVNNSNGYSESKVSKVVQNPENCCIICVGSTGTGTTRLSPWTRKQTTT